MRRETFVLPGGCQRWEGAYASASSSSPRRLHRTDTVRKKCNETNERELLNLRRQQVLFFPVLSEGYFKSFYKKKIPLSVETEENVEIIFVGVDVLKGHSKKRKKKNTENFCLYF